MRMLFLDGIPEGQRLPNVVRIASKEDISRLYAEHFVKLHPSPITLDCRSVRRNLFNHLLKFVEEYKAPLTMVADDPVPSPILSRFTRVKKVFTPRGGNLLGLRLFRVPHSMRDKVWQMYGMIYDR